MVRAIEYFLIAGLVLGIIATPGLGAIALLLLPFIGLAFVWRSALTVATRGRPDAAVVQTRRSHLRGPGGPDDSFAGPLDEGGYPAVVRAGSIAASGGARKGAVQGANVPRRDLARLRPASTATFHSEI
jgi:hypothetical protein